MWQRPLGNTGIIVSAIGLGTVKFGRTAQLKYPTSFKLPRETELANLLAAAQNYGINLLDTAPAYGDSEQRLGRLLTGQRHRWVVSTKVGEKFIKNRSFFDFSATAITNSVQQSLRQLKTDYLDIVLVHSNGDDLALIEQDEVFVTLAALQRLGLVRAYGMSAKTVAGGLCTLKYADLAMLSYNQQDTAALPAINYAAQHAKGIMIKKAFASGHLLQQPTAKDPVTAALEFVLAAQGVSTIVIGTINMAHLAVNVANVKTILGDLS
jgi:aryl-alcohol dehydrogenase-like predicted oxidoreductase